MTSENQITERVSFAEIDAEALIVKELAGIITRSGIIRNNEIGLILPDGETTLFSMWDTSNETAARLPGMQYLGVMRHDQNRLIQLRRSFVSIPPEWVHFGDKLVLANAMGKQSVRPMINGMQTRMTGYQSLFAMSE